MGTFLGSPTPIIISRNAHFPYTWQDPQNPAPSLETKGEGTPRGAFENPSNSQRGSLDPTVRARWAGWAKALTFLSSSPWGPLDCGVKVREDRGQLAGPEALEGTPTKQGARPQELLFDPSPTPIPDGTH